MMSSLPFEYADKTNQLLKTASREKKNQKLSSLAKKYSHPSVNSRPIPRITQSPLAGTFCSGLTPLSPFPPTTLQKRRIHNYQKRRLHGFTSAELEKLGALAGLGDDPYDSSFEDILTGKIIGPGYDGALDNALHPLIAKDNWEKEGEMPLHTAPIPVRGEDSGFWFVSNPNVWRVLEPCLQLASLLIQNTKIWPWWDAVLFGQLKPIARSRVDPAHQGNPLYSLHQRPIQDRTTASQLKATKDKLVYLKNYIRYRFWSGYTAPSTGAVENYNPDSGRQMTNHAKGQHYSTVNLAIELVQPLLTGNLNPDEILLARFNIATTLVHETSHAVWKYRQVAELFNTKFIDEPYFENEVLPELGWSLEAHMWGGQPQDVNEAEYDCGGPGLPAMGVFAGSFFNDCSGNHAYADKIALFSHLDPPPLIDPYYQAKHWPIPKTWFKDMQKKGKWKHLVAKFGPDTLHMGPKTVGTQFDTWNIDPLSLIPVRNNPMNLDALALSTPQPINMTPAEVAAMNTENARRSKALEIMAKIGNMSRMLADYITPYEQSLIDRIPPEEIETYPCLCPRYEALKKVFLENRAPLQLAIDSMDFGIPEPTMLRYIKDAGLIAITAEEFRAFLHCCNAKKELFKYEPFPGNGMMYKVNTGWPAPTPYRIRPTGTKIKASEYEAVLKQLQKEEFRTFMYWEHMEFRDIDINVLGLFVNHFLGQNNTIHRENFPFIIHEMAIVDPQVLTLGPRGIARLRTPIPQDWRDDRAYGYTRDKLAEKPWKHH